MVKIMSKPILRSLLIIIGRVSFQLGLRVIWTLKIETRVCFVAELNLLHIFHVNRWCVLLSSFIWLVSMAMDAKCGCDLSSFLLENGVGVRVRDVKCVYIKVKK